MKIAKINETFHFRKFASLHSLPVHGLEELGLRDVAGGVRGRVEGGLVEESARGRPGGVLVELREVVDLS